MGNLVLNHNLVLDSILNRTLNVDFQEENWTANYSEGDLFELWKFLQEQDIKYPVLWLQTGYEFKRSTIWGNAETELFNVNLFIITLGSLNAYYKDRFATTYDKLLYALESKVMNLLSKSKGITVSDDYKGISFPFNNVNELTSRRKDNGTKTIAETTETQDVWDALLIKIPSLKINGNCYTQFQIKP